MTKLTPMNDIVILKEFEPDQVTEGGLHIPKTSGGGQNEARYATVVAVGPGRVLDSGTRLEPKVKEGDTVLYLPRMTSNFQHEGMHYIACQELHIISVVGS